MVPGTLLPHRSVTRPHKRGVFVAPDFPFPSFSLPLPPFASVPRLLPLDDLEHMFYTIRDAFLRALFFAPIPPLDPLQSDARH